MSAEIDTSVWRTMVDRLMRELPTHFAEEALRIEAAEVIKRVVSFLPPNTQAQGRAAVLRDIRRAVRHLVPEDFVDPWLREIFFSGNLAAIQDAVNRIPQMAGLVVAAFSPRLHTSQRNNRGHVSSSTRPFLTVDNAALANYEREVQGRVGLLKSGYNPAASALGLSLPSWVRKHAGNSLGSVEIKKGTLLTGQSIVIVHRSGKYPDHRRVLNDALRYRTEALKSKVSRLVAGKWVNLGGSLGRVSS